MEIEQEAKMEAFPQFRGAGVRRPAGLCGRGKKKIDCALIGTVPSSSIYYVILAKRIRK